MTSIPYAADWWYSSQREPCSRTASSATATVAPARGRSSHPRAIDVQLLDERGVELGTIVAPRQGVVLAANGPTLYLQRR